jgi:hypothetical protein
LLDAAQQIFANHSLDSLPIVRANGVTGLQINFGSDRQSRKAEEHKDQSALQE